MTGEHAHNLPQVEVIPPVSSVPSGGWTSLWQVRHTVAAAAALPGLIALNWLITEGDLSPADIGLVVAVSLAQALVTASFVPQRNSNVGIVTCGAIPPATMAAASILLSELPTNLTFGFLAVALAGTGVAFRFFATTCNT
jgi:hypothetical protein